MKKSKILICILYVMILLSILILNYIHFNYCCEIAESFVIGVLSSSLVSLVITYLDYYNSRNNEIDYFKLETSKYFNILLNLQNDINNICDVVNGIPNVKEVKGIDSLVTIYFNMLKQITTSKKDSLNFSLFFKNKKFQNQLDVIYYLTFGINFSKIYTDFSRINGLNSKEFVSKLTNQIDKELNFINENMRKIRRFKISNDWRKNY